MRGHTSMAPRENDSISLGTSRRLAHVRCLEPDTWEAGAVLITTVRIVFKPNSIL